MEGKNTNKSEQIGYNSKAQECPSYTSGHKALPSPPPPLSPLGSPGNLRACSTPPAPQSWPIWGGGDEHTPWWGQGLGYQAPIRGSTLAPAEWTTRQRVDRVHLHPSPPSRAAVTTPYGTSGLPGSFKHAQVLPSEARISSRCKVKVAQLYPTLCSPMDSSMGFSRPEYWSG